MDVRLTMSARGPQVFISYQRSDGEFARRVRAHLVAAGVKTWMDQFDIPVGAYWPDEIDKGLTASGIVVGILSPDAVESRNVKNEWDWAIQNGKRLLLLQVQSCIIPHRYVSINFIDASGARDAVALAGLLESLGVSATPADASPRTRYAQSGDVNIAYQVLGTGPIDLVFVPGFVSNIEYYWQHPRPAKFYQALASFSRLITFDKRGTGLSDRITGVATLEQRMDDVRAVMDAAGSKQAALFGMSEGGALSMLFAATYPERTLGLILFGCYARRAWAPDYPWGRTLEQLDDAAELFQHHWGTAEGLELWAPSLVEDGAFRDFWGAHMRMAASPGTAIALWRMNYEIDARHLLAAIRVPTLILHRTGDRIVGIGNAHYLAEHIANSRLIELPGEDHLAYIDPDVTLRAAESFLNELQHPLEPDRILSTVLAVDFSTVSRELQELMPDTVTQHRGRLARSSTGVTATFDGPLRAIRCAGALVTAAHDQGIAASAGLHTGEIELLGDRVDGVPVRIAADLASRAATGEVLVSSTVKDLAYGAGIQFIERGSQPLAGLPDEWRLFAVDSASL